MRRRLRKKLRLGELRELGFRVRFRVAPGLDTAVRNRVLDQFLERAIEANDLQFGGGGSGDAWEGFAESVLPRVSAVEDQRSAVAAWLDAQPLVREHRLSPLIDAWHGDFAPDQRELLRFFGLPGPLRRAGIARRG